MKPISIFNMSDNLNNYTFGCLTSFLLFTDKHETYYTHVHIYNTHARARAHIQVYFKAFSFDKNKNNFSRVSERGFHGH